MLQNILAQATYEKTFFYAGGRAKSGAVDPDGGNWQFAVLSVGVNCVYATIYFPPLKAHCLGFSQIVYSVVTVKLHVDKMKCFMSTPSEDTPPVPTFFPRCLKAQCRWRGAGVLGSLRGRKNIYTYMHIYCSLSFFF